MAGCGSEPPPPQTSAPPGSEPPLASPVEPHTDVPREAFNRLAAELALPLFWASDDDGDGDLDPSELAVLWGVADSSRDRWVASGRLTPDFEQAYAVMLARQQGGASEEGLDEREVERRKLVLQELAQGRPTLIRTRLPSASAEDRAIVDNIVAAAALVEDIHLRQIGSHALEKDLPGHPASQMLFYRNQGPWCVAPETESKELCNAIPSMPKKISGLYPAAIQDDKNFCEALTKHEGAEQLRHPFFVVRANGKKLEAAAYHEAYAEPMKQVSAKLEAAAAAVESPGEQAFKRYLLAAAKAFRDGSWEAADEAWAAMNAKSSKWYLRIGPDEVYFEPCQLKAGFHVSFARINQDSLAWQAKLDPVKVDMEKTFAELAGAPYKARAVSFRLPDFIDIVLNAGDARSPHGATIGQSLPNWGPVAKEGRGRTVAMTNLYTDPDSKRELTAQASSLFCGDSMKLFDANPENLLLGTVIHEAAHNLGPSGEYVVGGKKAREIFGGPLASTLEELKAQTAALYFPDWLLERKLLSVDQVQKAHARDIAWTFGHISRGMYTADDEPRPYSHLAAIQVGFLIEHQALVWRAEEKAANGQDIGCMAMHIERFPEAVDKLLREVAGIKARGDKARGQALVKKYVDDKGAKKQLLDTIVERWLRAPKASFVYAIELD